AGADVLIERGTVHAAVVHPAGAGTARWAVRAGPFEVRVTGTTFDAAWDPMAETFMLTMIEGRVVVTGPNITTDRTVVGGEAPAVSVRDARMVLSTGPEAPAPSVPGASSVSSAEASATPAPDVTMGPQAAPNPRPAKPAVVAVGPQPVSS